MAGFVGFHKDVIVVAAGNRPEESKVAHLISAPLLNRFKVIRVEAPNVDEWKDYMDYKYGDEWDRRVYAFLKAYKWRVVIITRLDTKLSLHL
jgi:MoxR-like ATPase